MKLSKTQLVILGIILTIATAVRLVSLGSIPRGFTVDEASQGYSAYSLLKTGTDEWGNHFPISFKSLLDYKAPLLTYLMVPSIFVFGLNEFAVRLPNAVFGLLSVVAVFLLTRELINQMSKESKIKSRANSVALIAALLISLSPWHIQFSRTALEVSLGSFFIPMGLYLFLTGLRNNTRMYLAMLCFALSVWTYHAYRIFTPLFLISIFIIYYQNTRQKVFIVSALLFLILVSPIYANLVFGLGGARNQDLLITNLTGEELKAISEVQYYSPLARVNWLPVNLFDNKLTYILDKFSENYFSYFNLSYWFFEGGREITYSIIPGRGLLLGVLVLPFLFALAYAIRIRIDNKTALTILFWGLLAALPAALTKEGYRPNRSGAFATLFEMICAYGVVSILGYFGKIRKIISGMFLGILVLCFIFYINDYAFGATVRYPVALNYGWREAVTDLSFFESQYEHIMVEKSGQSQAYIAFYRQFDPNNFQNETRNWQKQINLQQEIRYLDQLHSYDLGKYHFETLNWPEDIKPKTLYLSPVSELLPSTRKTLASVKTPQGKVILEIFTFDE